VKISDLYKVTVKRAWGHGSNKFVALIKSGKIGACRMQVA